MNHNFHSSSRLHYISEIYDHHNYSKFDIQYPTGGVQTARQAQLEAWSRHALRDGVLHPVGSGAVKAVRRWRASRQAKRQQLHRHGIRHPFKKVGQAATSRNPLLRDDSGQESAGSGRR